MSNYSIAQRKHRFSTVTTSVPSHVYRLKTMIGQQFNTINPNIDIESAHPYIDKAKIKKQKQSRRYTQQNNSLRTHHQSLNLKQQVFAQKGRRDTAISLKAQNQFIGKPHQIKLRSQYGIGHQTLIVPYIKGAYQEVVGRENLDSSDKYMQHLQKQKNQRIKQIYNPQSIGIRNPIDRKSFSVFRKNKSKGININKVGAQELIQALQQNKNAGLKKQNNERSVQKIDKNNTSLTHINLMVNQKISKPITKYSIPKILPVTFQKIDQLSVIKQGKNSKTQSQTQGYSIDLHNKNKSSQKRRQSSSREHNDPENRSTGSKAQTNKSEQSLPYPKFNNFVDNYRKQQSFINIEFNKAGESDVKRVQQVQDVHIGSHNLHQSFQLQSESSKSGIRQLSIFENIDKSVLKVVKYEDGVYYGQVDHQGFKNGKGAIFYHNGKIYEGEFHKDFISGHGCEQHTDNSAYIGEFKNGKRFGKGRFEWANGEIYDGQWQNNLKHGSGLWECRNSGASYIGEWSYGQISGFGVLTNEKGQRYEGQFKFFNKQGHGAFRFVNGDRIVGAFKKNQPNGQCQYFWANGDYYKGQFSNGLRHGKGIIKYADQSIFEGDFRNDKKCGLGREIYNDGITYYGNYQNDLRHGYGKLIYNDEIYYEGYWLNNLAVIFQQNYLQNEQILEDEKERLVSGMSNNLSSNKLKKLPQKQQQNILKSMRSKAVLKKSSIQKFSSKNLLDRLCQPKLRCKCQTKH